MVGKERDGDRLTEEGKENSGMIPLEEKGTQEEI